MPYKKSFILVLASTVVFTLLFYKQSLGLNILLFEAFILLVLIAFKQLSFKNRNIIIISITLFVSMLTVVFVNSVLSVFVNIIISVLFGGIVLYPEVKSLINSARLSWSNFFASQSEFFKNILYVSSNGRHKGLRFKKIKIFLIPLIIIIIFISIYSYSNPAFEKITSNILTYFDNFFNIIFNNIEISLVFTILVGMAISNAIFFRKSKQTIIDNDVKSTDFLSRFRKRSVFRFGFNALKNELKAAIFLLFTLNIVIFILNILDIYWVWFNFSWNGELLKQFVHEGTYLLILSILISIVIVLYYFRGNLNFYSKNKWLKNLSYVWLMQNAILVISVAIRNYWYIYYYSLAYKRIGVIFFLILTLYGLYSVYIKVKNQKSTFYLLRKNSLAFVIIIMFFSFFNWDIIIARYNFAQRNRAFVHFNFMASLSDKALPYLEYPVEELEKIQQKQDSLFPLTREGRYINALEYVNRIEIKKADFKKKWESKGILEWNYPDYKAYRKLFKK